MGTKPQVLKQVFSLAALLGGQMQPPQGAGYGGYYGSGGKNGFWHPGFAWAARREAIDAVGGKPLDDVLRSTKQRGVVCAFGNAAGETFSTSIYPFILRAVSLVGINGNHPVPTRGSVWQRMQKGGDLRPKHIHQIAYTIAFDDLKSHCDKLISSGVRGRAVVQF
jgi:hypothetical protein